MPKSLAVAAVLTLAACASPATVEGMSTTPAASQTAALPAELRNTIEIGMVGGGEPTNPLWTSEVGNEEFREALTRSLRSAGLLAPPGGTVGYLLEATLVDVQQPMFGFDTQVVATVDYRMTPRNQEGETFQTVVAAPYTARMADSMIAVQRLRLANEGAIRENIREFIDRLTAFYGD